MPAGAQQKYHLLAFDIQGRRAFTRFRGADVTVLGSKDGLGGLTARS